MILASGRKACFALFVHCTCGARTHTERERDVNCQLVIFPRVLSVWHGMAWHGWSMSEKIMRERLLQRMCE